MARSFFLTTKNTQKMDFAYEKSTNKSFSNMKIVFLLLAFVVGTVWCSPRAIPDRRHHEHTECQPQKAIVILRGDSPVSGIVTFEQSVFDGPVIISGEVRGLNASARHGFHVHQYGDLSNGCTSAGPHFNPFNKTHGAPWAATRHVGDLGNIDSDEEGVATINMQDSLISLMGERSILGRAVVVHTGTDDLGLGGNDESLRTGNAGSRAACGVIGEHLSSFLSYVTLLMSHLQTGVAAAA
ncbi:superoxide dismutase [Cyathus striatus]|nr:superoxide dismutase [Cyathus striatus]